MARKAITFVEKVDPGLLKTSTLGVVGCGKQLT